MKKQKENNQDRVVSEKRAAKPEFFNRHRHSHNFALFLRPVKEI